MSTELSGGLTGEIVAYPRTASLVLDELCTERTASDRLAYWATQVDEAVAAAEPLTPDGLVPSVPGELTHAVQGSELVLRLPARDDLLVPANVVVDHPRHLIQISHGIAARSPSGMLGSDITDSLIRELDRCAHVAETFGYRDGFIGLVIGRDASGELHADCRFFAPGFSATNLELALINIIVAKPSEADLAAIRAYGFDSPAAVLAAAEQAGIVLPFIIHHRLQKLRANPQ